MNVLDEFRWRGMLYDMTEGAEDVLAKEKIVVYAGFDAQGPSLHVGHLIPIMGLLHMQRYGHTPIALLGGGTSMVGDPSGKSKERALLSWEMIAANVENIREQLSRFLDFEKEGNAARMRNNADWLRPIGLMEFLRDTGKHFTIQQMLAKDSVKQRLEKEEGLSFTEFSYMLLQAFDFLTLFRQEGCTFQIGGSDQWGNITAGSDLVRKVSGGKAHAVVFPLLTTASGEKFGKTANLAGEMDSVWLDARMTSPYKFYQYWINADDADVGKYLRLFTLLSRDEIEALDRQVQDAPERREAQKRLAEEITRLVHGEAGLRSAQQASGALFSGTVANVDNVNDILGDVRAITVSGIQLQGMTSLDVIVAAGIAPSKGQGRQLMRSGGVYLCKEGVERLTDVDRVLTKEDTVDGEVIVLRKGKKDYFRVIVEDED